MPVPSGGDGSGDDGGGLSTSGGDGDGLGVGEGVGEALLRLVAVVLSRLTEKRCQMSQQLIAHSAEFDRMAAAAYTHGGGLPLAEQTGLLLASHARSVVSTFWVMPAASLQLMVLPCQASWYTLLYTPSPLPTCQVLVQRLHAVVLMLMVLLKNVPCVVAAS